MKEKIDLIKKMWSNQNSKALIFFGFYFLFFILVFSICSSTEKPKLVPLEKEEVKEEIKKETFYDLNEYSFYLETNGEKIIGNYNDSDLILYYKNTTYKYFNKILEPNNFPYIDIIPYLDNKYLSTLIKDREYYSKTEYNDGLIKTEYHIDNVIILITESSDINEIDISLNGNLYNIYIDYE